MAEFTDEQLTRSYADAAELDARAGEALEARSPEEAAANPCDAWRDIRQWVVAVSELYFLPKRIRALMRLVILIVDSLCR